MNWVTDFFVPLGVNMVGVFVGVVLALWTDRRRQEVADAQAARRLSVEFAGLREVVLSSVVKDTIEATRVKASLASRSDPYMLEIYLELAVWEAAQVAVRPPCPLDDRSSSAGSSTRSAGWLACWTSTGDSRRTWPRAGRGCGPHL